MTDAELAILSIIAEAPISGYDIQDVIDERNLRRWTLIGVESVYYVIEKLAKQGLVAVTPDTADADRKARQYQITSAGMGVLQTAVTDLLSSPRHLPHPFDLGLANLPTLEPHHARHAVMRYRATLYSRYNTLKSQLAEVQEQNIPFHIISMYEHQITLAAAELQWLDGWIEEWVDRLPEEPPDAKKIPTIPLPPRIKQMVLPDDEDSIHKRSTREHADFKNVEYPPPPQKREPSAPDETRVSDPTRGYKDQPDDLQ